MKFIRALLCLLPMTGCGPQLPPLKTMERVDIDRFMGKWFVIACIPTVIEKKAYNATETYRLIDDRTIDTIFRFNKNSLEGPVKTYNPKGFIRDEVNNSTWGMQFVWPIKSEYLITYLDDDYSQTIVSRNKRDYVWIMARSPEISEDDYERLKRLIVEQGYDVSRMRKVPHNPQNLN